MKIKIEFSFDNRGNAFLDFLDDTSDVIVEIPTKNLVHDSLQLLAEAVRDGDKERIIKIWHEL